MSSSNTEVGTKKEEEEDTIFLRYYVGHKGEFGHEYFEIECNEQGRIRYTNSSMYKKDGLITRQGFLFF